MSVWENSQLRPAGSRSGFPSIRTMLLMLILGIMVPMLAQVAVIAWYYGVACKRTLEAQRLDVASNVSYLVDREVQGRAGFLSGIGLSPAFQEGREDVVKAITAQALEGGFEGLALFDPAGRLKFASPPAMQPLFANPSQLGIGEIVAGSRVFVSDFLPLDGAKAYHYVISVPITVNEKLTYVLSGALTPKRLQALFSDPESGLPDSWVAGVVDRNGVVLARSHRPEAYVGTVAQEPMKQVVRSDRRSGVFDAVSRDGISMANTFVRSATTGWTSDVAVPTAVVNAPLWESMLSMIVLALGLTLLALLLAVFVANRIARAVHQLGRAAVAFAAGDVVPIEVSNTAHIEDVSQALEAAAATANRREARRRG